MPRVPAPPDHLPGTRGAAVLRGAGRSGKATTRPSEGAIGSADRSVIFASDGMRPDLMQRYASEGVMPTYSALMQAV